MKLGGRFFQHIAYGLGAIQLVRKSSSWKIFLEEDWVGATVSFSVNATVWEESLNTIDELRDQYGAPESEQRNLGIESGQPLPIVR